MRLWLDAGNTRFKWQLCDGKHIVDAGFVVHENCLISAVKKLAEYLRLSGRLDCLEYVGLASVLSTASLKLIEASVLEEMSLILVNAEVRKEFKGLRCAYKDVSRLGTDRWLALLAGFELSDGAVCVVDCGSAMTVDVADSTGKHLGGFIMPGLNMSVQALLGKTDSVRFDDDGEFGCLAFGVDSAAAVKNGALFQAQATIKEVWSYCQSLTGFENSLLLVTGGDAPNIVNGLDIQYEIHSDLVLQGLRLALSE